MFSSADREQTVTKRRSGSGPVALLGAFFVTLLVLAGVALVDSAERARYVQAKRSDALLYASVVRAEVESALQKRLRITYGLAAFARSQFDELPANFYAFSEALLQSGVTGIRSLQLAPQAVVRYVHPYKSNERVLGHDLLADPKRRDAVLRAIEQRQFIVAGPVDLLQGGRGLVARLPIYRDTEAGERFWGFATVVMDVEPLLAEAHLTKDASEVFDVGLRGKDGLGEAGRQFFGAPEVFERDPVLLEIDLPHGNWQVAVVMKAGWPTSAPASPIIWSIGMILAVVASGLTAMVLLAPATLRREVTRATRALRDSEEQFRRVAETATDAIVSADAAGNICFWNRGAELAFGYSAAEAVGRPITMLMPLRFRSAHQAGFDRSLRAEEEGARASMALFGLHKDGGEFPVELSSARWVAGGAIFHTAIIRDVSERKASERQQSVLQDKFHRAQRLQAIGTLAGGAAHEFNNILNSIMANADSAAMQLGSAHPASTAVTEVQEGAWRAAEIVRRLLVFSEQQDLDAPPVRLADTVSDAVEAVRADATPWTAITSHVAADALDAEVAIDPQQVGQLVSSIAVNAMQAFNGGAGSIEVSIARLEGPQCRMPHPCDGETVSVELGHVESWPALALTIADDGCGMDAEVLNRAFEPFFTTRAVGTGSGLGLSVVHGIVQRSGGAISVESCPGKGTRVTVYLPVVAAAAPAEADPVTI